MYDKALIERICNLTCTKEDVDTRTDEIDYDTNHPFKKYYNADIIVGAFNKYLSREWSGQFFANWCILYSYIFCGGPCGTNDYLNSLEKLLTDVISYDLDGLSFLDDEDLSEVGTDVVCAWREEHKNWGHILNTIDDWQGICAPVGPDAEYNHSLFVILLNKKLKEYMIIYAESCDATDDKESFRHITEEDFDNIIEELKADGYTLLSCHEELYYSVREPYDEDDEEDLED